jgi:hypothetical protein
VSDTAAPDTVYITDAELIRRLGVPEKIARQTIRALDAMPKSGFPKKNKLWGDRRHWPSVRAYLESQEQGRLAASSQQRRGTHGGTARV